MNGTLYIMLTTLIYIIIVSVTYFSKSRIKDAENEAFSLLIIISIISVIIDSLSTLSVFYSIDDSNTLFILTRGYLISCMTWIMVFTYYSFLISFSFKEKKNTIIKTIFISIWLICDFMLLFLPLYYKTTIDGSFSYGPAANLSYGIGGICIFMCLILMFKNIKKIGNRKFLPLYLFGVICLLVGAIQFYFPSLLLITSAEALVTIMMYFTIENPDMKMLEEYQKNREYADATNREKAVFLFNITQDIRKPLNEIGEACNELSLMTNNKEINKGINYIDSTSRNLLGFVNGVLDISNLETCNIKVYNTKYNPTLILNELVKSAKETINKDVDFRVNIDKSIPELLYGDSMRIKQVIKTLLDNASKYTKEGYIELNVHEIRKESLCRLLITVEDSGSGIKADEYALIFDKNREDDEVHKIDDSKNNLAVAKTVAALLGGLLTFTTSIGEGTKFTFILDQKMVEDTSKEFKQIEKYTKAITKPTVIVVSEDEEYLSTAVKKISKYDLDVTGSNLGAKCIEKIRHNVKCDYILLDEDLLTLDIYEVLTKLKEIKDFHSKVYVLSRNTDNLKLIKNGFDKVISRKIKGSEISELEKDE